MNYQIVWEGQLRSVSVPSELETEIDRWTYVMAFVAGGSVEAGMRCVLARQFPGLAWMSDSGKDSDGLSQPRGLDAVLNGSSRHDPGVVSSHEPGVPLSSHDMSSPAAPSRSRSQKPPRSGGVPRERHAASDSATHHKHHAPPPTSTGSRHAGHARAARGPPSSARPPKPAAMPHMVGWMGRAPTTSSAAVVAPPAS